MEIYDPEHCILSTSDEKTLFSVDVREDAGNDNNSAQRKRSVGSNARSKNEKLLN